MYPLEEQTLQKRESTQYTVCILMLHWPEGLNSQALTVLLNWRCLSLLSRKSGMSVHLCLRLGSLLSSRLSTFCAATYPAIQAVNRSIKTSTGLGLASSSAQVTGSREGPNTRRSSQCAYVPLAAQRRADAPSHHPERL